MFGAEAFYYAVQVRDMTIWVPADNKLKSRLQAPASEIKFKQLLNILSGPGELLPNDHHERKAHLLELGRTESLCHTIQKTRSLNNSDDALLKHSRNILLGEWEFVISVPRAQFRD
jgi:hypothetical protein